MKQHLTKIHDYKQEKGKILFMGIERHRKNKKEFLKIGNFK
jgi:hypothetical protein